jgi:isoquinoline 1-oxidoreductase beta subunit
VNDPAATPKNAEANVSRRHFLIGSGVVGAGLVLGLTLARRGDQAAQSVASGRPLAPNAFLRVAPDETVTVIIGKAEMGQGVYTSLPMVVAEELDIDPRRVRVEFAPVDPAFNHPFLPAQFTGGSMSTNSTYEPLRQAGATARAMLLAAAAQRWGVDATSLTTSDGSVRGAEAKQRATYGSLASAAAELPVPEKVPVKDSSAFKYIGKPLGRLDNTAKISGRAEFGIDVDRPNMLIAMVARSPVIGGRVKTFNDEAARAVPGVVEVRQVPTGVVVYANNTWAARVGRDALTVEWDEGSNAGFSTNELRTEYRKLLRAPATPAKTVGNVGEALRGAARTIDVEYELPYLAHACMEPLNCVAVVSADRCEIWTGSQYQSEDRKAAAAALGMQPEQVILHTTFLGGGFGRRANPVSDFVVEGVQVAQALAGRPVKTIWTREDDTRGWWYRPFVMARVRAGIGADGAPVAWHQTIVSQPVLKGTAFAPFAVQNGIDPTTIEGAADMPYALPNLTIDFNDGNPTIPIQWWRSVGHTHTAFVVNSVMDELAALADQDPVEYRRALLGEKPRHLAVLNAVAEMSAWGSPLPAGHARGVAIQESFASIVAQVAEVSVEGTEVRVHKVWCAIDCGLAVNPDGIAAQMESGIVYGLSAAVRDEITIENGRVVQGNFDSYPVLRMNETPEIGVRIVPSSGPMGGAGEPATPPIAPAVTNAIYAATGKRVRRLPIAAALASA